MSSSSTKWRLSWDGGHVDVYSLGGMVVPVFNAATGSGTVSPLFVAPWTGDAAAAK